MRVAVIAGAPGVGKSTVAALVQRELGCPLFEFGWIPEFRETGTRRLSYVEEADLAFENLCLVTRNYLRHGFRRVLLTDLDERHVVRVPEVLRDADPLVVTLRLGDDERLRRRVLDESRSSAYRDADEAIRLDRRHGERAARPREVFVDVGERSAQDVATEVLGLLG